MLLDPLSALINNWCLSTTQMLFNSKKLDGKYRFFFDIR